MMRLITSSVFLLALGLFSTLHAQTAQEQIGKASYYGDYLHGRKTASGELYDKTKFTCANNNFPFGTKLIVTRIDNDKSVLVVVNDRSGHRDGFIIDLSRAAAEAIDMIKDGVVRVKIQPVTGTAAPKTEGEILSSGAKSTAVVPVTNSTQQASTITKVANQSGSAATNKSKWAATKGAQTVSAADPTPQTPKAAKTTELYQVSMKKPAKSGFAVQVAVLSNPTGAMNQAAKLEEKWPGKVLMLVESVPTTPNAAPLYKLLIGPYSDRKTADQAHLEATRKGFPKAFVIDLSTQ